MLKILRYIIASATLVFAIYGFITKDFQFGHLMIFLLGITSLMMGLEEFQQQRKVYGMLLVFVFLFSLIASIQGFLLSYRMQ